MTSHNIVTDYLYDEKNSKLIPEPDRSGNIEYKLHLNKKTLEKKDNMVAQLLWRMNEGRNLYGIYEAHYILGVYDNGELSDISERKLNLSYHILQSVVKKANGRIISNKIYVFPKNKILMHVIIRKKHREHNIPENDIIILGPSNVGKSSLMGLLTYGQNDNGNGFSRKLVLRHQHEKKTGNTSSIKYDTIGFNGHNIVNYGIGIDYNMENIYNMSDRLINLIDLPGDFRYIKTILHSISSSTPEHILLCIPAFNENKTILDYINENSEFYKLIITICTVYNIEPIIILTKCDLVDNDMKQYKHDILKCFTNWSNEINNISFIDFMESDIINVSSVSEDGYDELIDAISYLPIKSRKMLYNNLYNDIFFKFIEVFTIPDTGTIYHGLLCNGTINVDDTIEVLCHNVIKKFKIKSIHRKSLNVESLFAGETGSITFYGITNILDKTCIIIGEKWKSYVNNTSKFKVLSYTCELKEKQYLLYICNNIVPVIVSFSDNEYIFKCINNMTYLTNISIAILRDNNDYFFIQLHT